MRVMALDYGTRRTGVAVCDALEITVRPVATIRGANRQAAVAQAIEWAQQLEVECIIIGLPLNMDGSEGPAAKRVRVFAGLLAERVSLPIELYDERLTSYEAERLLRERGAGAVERQANSDQWAAVVLLEDYLAARSNQR